MELSQLTDPRHQRLVEWLCTPRPQRDPKTATALAEELGVSPRTIRDWKAREDVRRVWDKLSRDIVGEPEKIAEVIEEMRVMAMSSASRDADRIRAANLYLDAVDAIRPKDDQDKKPAHADIDELTDEALEQMIAVQVAKMRAEA